MPDNKRQHYVPKYALKYFASDDAQRQISLINIGRRKIIHHASLREQCYRDYLYGSILDLEQALSKMEGLFASITKEMVLSDAIDARQGYHIALMVALQKARTLRAEQELDWAAEKLVKTMMYNRVDETTLREVKIGINGGLNMNIGQALRMSPLLLDMKQFLVRNRTTVPFIISDNPVVLTNWFCRARIRNRWSAGMAISGLQMLMPLSPKHALLLHDSNVYTTQSMNNTLDIRRASIASALNELQWLNAYKNVYLPPECPDSMIDDLVKLDSPHDGRSFRRFENTVEPGHFSVTDKDEFAPPTTGVTSEIIHLGTVPFPKDIRIDGIALRSSPRIHDNGSMGSPIRDPAWIQIVEDFGISVGSKERSFNDLWDFVSQHHLVSQIGPWLARNLKASVRRR